MSTLVEDMERLSIPPKGKLEAKSGSLTVLRGPVPGFEHRLEGEICTVGRSERADFCIPELGLSRVHARIVRVIDGQHSEFWIEDGGSTNGTFVDDIRIEGRVSLLPGARVRLGRSILLKFSVHDELEASASLKVQQSALRDRLTGAFNRGVFDDRLATSYRQALAMQAPLSVVLFDVDHFKRFNDEWGHQAGDAVLREIGAEVNGIVRASDIFARYGGEEFVILAPGTSLRNACVLGERVRKLIEERNVQFDDQPLAVSVSVGVAALSPGGHRGAAERDLRKEALALVRTADRALYEAKGAGRNCVVAHSFEPGSSPAPA
jgi:diguanylate cyclase (GGDEF)-like protein